MKIRRKIIVIFCLIIVLNLSVISSSALSTEKSEIINESNEEIITSTNGKGNCAVFVTGAGPGCDLLANEAYKGATYFNSQGYNTKVISYYSNMFPVLSTRNALISWVPENLAEDGQVFIYLGGHSDILSNVVIGIISSISEGTLNLWVTRMENNCNPSIVTIVVESCQSGSFINPLKNDNRIVITSTDTLHSAYYNSHEELVYFSTPFFNALRAGKSYGAAWEDADYKIDCLETRQETSIDLQDPKINDGKTDGTSSVDKLKPKNRLALRVYPSHIKTYKSVYSNNIVSKLLDRFPAIKNIFYIFEKIKMEYD